MHIQDVLQRYEEELHCVEEIILSQQSSFAHSISEVTSHIIKSGGKRFRPLLMIIAADLFGYGGTRMYPLGAFIEFIHTASLLHDDVIDHADTRRGERAANIVWGNSVSILVGDYLYAKSFNMLIDDGGLSVQKLLAGVTATMTEGEMEQLARCRDLDITEEEYIAIIARKTAILISVSCSVGALLADASTENADRLRQFGMNLGLAYQLTDDSLDYIAVENELGKTIGMDIKDGNITLPLIKVLKECRPLEKDFIKKVITKKDISDEDLQGILSLIHQYKGIDYALGKAKTYVEEGKRLLASLPESQPREALFTIADYLVERRL